MLSSFFKHFLIRLMAVFTSPSMFAYFFLTAISSLLYWPGLVDPEQFGFSLEFDRKGGGSESVLVFMWIVCWPMLVGSVAGGGVTGNGKEALAVRPLPSLPVGTRVRALAETLLIVLFALAVRIPCLIWGEEVYQSFYLPGLLDSNCMARDAFLDRSIMGTFIMLPAILCWTAPAPGPRFYFIVRPLALVLMYLIAMPMGLLATPMSCILTCTGISALILFSVGREFHPPRWWGKAPTPAHVRYRTGCNPEKRLRRDLWTRPLFMFWVLMSVEAVLLILDSFEVFPDLGFYMASSIVFGFIFSFVVLRPLGVYMIDAAVVGKTGSPANDDYHRTWMVLPVRREAMTRGIFFHGIIAGLVLWGAVLAVNLVNSWLTTGEARLMDMDGDSANRYLLYFVAVVPCIAGGLVSFAVGSIFRGIFNTVLAGAVFFSHVTLLVKKAPPALHVTVVALLALMGVCSVLRFLKSSRDVGKGYT